MSKLTYIEGIGERYAEKLHDLGIDTDRELLEKGAKPYARQSIAKASGISKKLVLKWVNRADLTRVVGIGSEYADLLEWAGIDTVIELASRNPDNLYACLQATNQKRHLVRHMPSKRQVHSWVMQAKKLPRVIMY